MFSTITHFKAPPQCLLAQFHTYQLRPLKQKKKGLKKQEAQRKASPPYAKAVMAELSTQQHERQPMGGRKGTNSMNRTDKQCNVICQRKQTFDLQA